MRQGKRARVWYGNGTSVATGSRGSVVDPEVAMASLWEPMTRKSKEVSRGVWRWALVRAGERGAEACNRKHGLGSDKLSRAAEQSSGTLQDLRFWKTRRAGTRKSRSVGGIRKDGTDGERERERWGGEEL